MPVSLPVPESLLRTFLLVRLPSAVEEPALQLVGGVLRLTGRVRTLGVAVPFELWLEPQRPIEEEGSHYLKLKITRLKPLDVGWLLGVALWPLNSLEGVVMYGRVLRLDVDWLLDRLPGWKRMPLFLRRSIRLKDCVIPDEGGRVLLVFEKARYVRSR